jgi:putative salt-induced outer membrane protein YdiY
MRSHVLHVCAFLALAAAPASGDTVKLKNGDTLTGTVVSVLGGKVVLKTEAAGDVTIDAAQVESLSTDQAIQVALPGGATFSGRAAMASGGTITVDADGIGPQTVALTAVEINKPAAPDRKWTGAIVGAATWTRGNTYTNQMSLDMSAVNRGEIDRITFDAWYRASRQKDQSTGVTSTSERRVGGGLKYDHFMGEKAYWYAQMTAEKNAIAALDLRFVAGGGLGWQFIETDATNLSAEAGASWFSENYSNGTSTVDEMAVRAAFHFDHKFDDVHSMFDDTEVFKIFDGPRDYLVKTKGGFRQKFTASFFAQEWVEFYWDPTPATGKGRRDTTYYIGIGWTF